MASKRFDASTPRPKSDGGTYWVRVGSAFQNEQSGQITVFLDAYPVPDEKGQVKIMLFEPRDRDSNQQQPRQQNPQLRQVKPEGSATWPEDDEIPF